MYQILAFDKWMGWDGLQMPVKQATNDTGHDPFIKDQFMENVN